MEKINLLVFGAGAIGTYVGGLLALAGNDVVFLEQPAAVEGLRQRGLILYLGAGRKYRSNPGPTSAVFHPANVSFASSLEEALERAPFDAALYALKSFDTTAALAGMKPFADHLPPILCLSNGVDNEPEMTALLGPGKVIAGTVTASVGRRQAGDIVLERERGLGVAEGHPLSLFLAGILSAAGLKTRLYPRPADMKWSKMLTNLPANATAAILDMTAAEVFSHSGLFQLEMKMMREALAVMKGLGVRVVDLPGIPVRALALGSRLPAGVARPLMKKAVGGGRGGKMPSFHIDLHSGRGKSEVEWLNGAIVRHGQKCSLPTPVNKVLLDTLLGLTRGEIPLSGFSRQPEKLIARVNHEE